MDDGGGRAVVESKFLRAINFGEVVWRRRGNFVRGKNEEEGNMKMLRGRDYGFWNLYLAILIQIFDLGKK